MSKDKDIKINRIEMTVKDSQDNTIKTKNIFSDLNI